MGIKYHDDEVIKSQVRTIVKVLELDHVDVDRVFCIRSHGSVSERIIARCHALPKILQQCLGIQPAYVIEVVTENYDNQSEEDRIKTLIHELLHIPKTFGGGFIHHNVVNRRTVDKMYKEYLRKKYLYHDPPKPEDFIFENTEEKVKENELSENNFQIEPKD
jgi:predicted metallopeptidase